MSADADADADDRWTLRGTLAVIATMHGKEPVIAEALAPLALAYAAPPAGFDTDRFGTFTRDVARVGSQLDAARAKANAALAANPQARVAIASEGAFGPHPELPLLPGGHELVLLLDRATGLELTGRDRTFDTNYIQRSVASLAEAEALASAIGFPEHSIILMSDGGAKPIDRDIATWPQLRAAVNARLEAEGVAWIEADMRAHRNPLRMAAIGRAAARLAASFGARCPGCRRPGWVPDQEAGRPCGWCEGPTIDHWIDRFTCAGCALTETRTIDPERRAYPTWCENCNP